MSATDGPGRASSADARIEARISDLTDRVRSVLQDPEVSRGDVDRAIADLIPELQRLTEHLEAARGPRFARVCESCGRLDLRVRWRTITEAEEAVGGVDAEWTCRWCGRSDFVVLEMGDAVSVGQRGPRSVLR